VVQLIKEFPLPIILRGRLKNVTFAFVMILTTDRERNNSSAQVYSSNKDPNRCFEWFITGL